MKKLFFTLLSLLFFFVSCGDSSAGETKDETNDEDSEIIEEICKDETNDEDSEIIEEICMVAGEGPYDLKFTDISEEMGVKTLNALGTQIAIADIDGDKWPDVYASLASKLREDPEAPSNLYKLLKNVNGESFQDVTFSSKLFAGKNGENGIASTYVVFADMNNDGFQDAFNVVYVDGNVYNDETFQKDFSRIYLNNGDGTFRLGPSYNFSLDLFEAFAGVASLDYDHDGIIDLFIGRHYNFYGHLNSCEQDTLLKGNGDGSFTNVTTGESGLETVKATEESLANGKYNKPTWGVSACDVDGDGFDDILTSSYGRAFNMLYRNKGDGSFEDLSLVSGFASDDNENYADDQFFACYCEDEANAEREYCSISKGAKMDCSSNNGGWQEGFSDQPCRLGGNSAGTLCADFDGDGDVDLFQIELAHWHIGESSDKSQLILNDGFPENPLRRIPESESGITRVRLGSWNDGDLGGMAADFDNDGRTDIYLLSSDYPGAKSMLFQQQADKTFKNVAKDSNSEILRAHGGAYVDIDRDGDYDLIVGVSFMRWSDGDLDASAKPEKQWIRVLRNDSGQNANKVIIDIVGDSANRDALGAKIIVRAGGKEFIREVQGSYGLNGFKNDSLQIIGLGNLCKVDEIEIHWPDKENSVTKYNDVHANYLLEINQKSGLKHHKLEEYFNRRSTPF